MSKDLIKRRLEKTKEEVIKKKKTVDLVPAGVPEAGEDTNSNESSVPGFITGGPKASKKRKEV